MKTLTEFKKEFNNIDLLKLFEVEVINRNGERDYIIFDVEIRGKKLIASHEPLTKKEEENKYIAFESIDIFQFQCGAIKRFKTFRVTFQISKFQFQCGAIKS